MKRNLRVLVVLFAALTAACSADKVASPGTVETSSVSIVKITSKPVTDMWSAIGIVAVGRNTIDSTNIVGDHSLFYATESNEHTYAIKDGEKIDIMLAILSSIGTYSDTKHPGTYQLITDWKPVEPSKHNLKFDSGFEVIFMREGYPSNTSGEMLPNGRAIRSYESRRIAGTGAITYTIKSDAPTVNFVTVAQVYRLSGCPGSLSGDSITLKSQQGVGFINEGLIWGRLVNANKQVQEITLQCTWYPNAEAAKLAHDGADISD